MNTKINRLSLTLNSSETHVRYRGEWYEIFEDQEGDQYIQLKTRALYIELPVPQTFPSLSTGEYKEPDHIKDTIEMIEYNANVICATGEEIMAGTPDYFAKHKAREIITKAQDILRMVGALNELLKSQN